MDEEHSDEEQALRAAIVRGLAEDYELMLQVTRLLDSDVVVQDLIERVRR